MGKIGNSKTCIKILYETDGVWVILCQRSTLNTHFEWHENYLDLMPSTYIFEETTNLIKYGMCVKTNYANYIRKNYAEFPFDSLSECS